jgi:Tol biopolymer transport system component/DNA-binding winged helix-turn-helix (wHTH) protein
MPVIPTQRLRFGPFELDLQTAELFKFGQRVKLQGQPIQVLSILLETPGVLVTREELRQRLWPSETGTFVDFDHGLNTDIRKLRAALGDEAETPRYIETLPRRGYRFIAELMQDHGPANQPGARPKDPTASQDSTCEVRPEALLSTTIADNASRGPAGPQATSPRNRLRLRVLVLEFVPVLLLAVFLLLRQWFGPTGPRINSVKQLTFSGKVGGFQWPTVENYSSIQTDGRRIYYSGTARAELHSTMVGGGEESTLRSPVSSPGILHISPDGSTLLVKEVLGPTGSTEGAIWLVSSDGSGWRRLAEVEAQDAAWAPDGKTIVFAKGQDLYLTNVQGTSPVKLATTPGRPFWLRWSPDGQKLRFTVVDPDRITYALWEVRLDGRLRKLLTNWKGAGQVCCGVWTANGKYFLLRNFRDNRLDYWILSDQFRLAERTEPTLLSPGAMEIIAATTSPWENKIFVEAASPTWNVVRLELRTSQTSIVYPESQATSITYSNDGQFIAYSRNKTAGGELFRSRIDGSDRVQLTVAPMQIFMERYSPDNQRIAFMARWPDQPWKIYWVPNNGGAIHEISSPVQNQADPNWSADGQSIIFGQPPDYFAEFGVARAIYRYDLPSKQISQIPRSIGLFSPRCSPDGRYLAAMTTDQRAIKLLDFSTGQWCSLVQHSVDNPFWSPDSAWVYFNGEGAVDIWRVRISDSHLERVPVRGDLQRYNSCNARGFAPDGSVLLSCRDYRTDLYALSWE